MDYKNFINLSLSQGVNFSIGKTINEAFSLVGKNAGSYIGYTIVFFFISMAAGLFGAFVPFIGGIAAGVLVTPALIMGYATFARRSELGEPTSFENFFDAFKINYGQLVIVNLILQLVQMGLMFLLFIPFFGDAMDLIQSPEAFGDPDYIEEFLSEITATMIQYWWVFAIYIFASLTIQVVYALANYFVIFYGFGFWEAMESSRHLMGRVFIKSIVLFIIIGIIVGIGTVVTLFFGILFFLPFSILASYSLFKQLAGFADGEVALEDDLII